MGQVRDQVDLRRDVIKAESAAVAIPELDMELGIGTLGGLITTVEARTRSHRLLNLLHLPATPQTAVPWTWLPACCNDGDLHTSMQRLTLLPTAFSAVLGSTPRLLGGRPPRLC